MNHTKLTITAGCLVTSILTMFGAHAEEKRVSSMVYALKGSSSYSKPAPVQKRSVKIASSRVKPKGYSKSSSSSYQSKNRYTPGSSSYTGKRYSAPVKDQICYHVDPTAKLSTNRIQFRKNSTEIEGYSYQYLYNLAEALQSHQLCTHRFVIEGHASAEGSWSTNQSLSQRRANAIFDFLVSRGVQPSRLLSVGHGEVHAHYSASAPEYLRASDRRVMIFKLAD